MTTAIQITCPECHARPGELCHNGDGATCLPHSVRWPDERAEALPCPKCGAEPGYRCSPVGLTDVHAERVALLATLPPIPAGAVRARIVHRAQGTGYVPVMVAPCSRCGEEHPVWYDVACAADGTWTIDPLCQGCVAREVRALRHVRGSVVEGRGNL